MESRRDMVETSFDGEYSWDIRKVIKLFVILNTVTTMLTFAKFLSLSVLFNVAFLCNATSHVSVNQRWPLGRDLYYTDNLTMNNGLIYSHRF